MLKQKSKLVTNFRKSFGYPAKDTFVLQHSPRYLLRGIVVFSLVFIGSFFATAFASHSLTPASDSKAEDTIYSDFYDNPALSFALTDPADGSALSSIDLSTSPNTLATKTVSLLASTGNSTGYQLTFSNDDEDTALYLDGDTTSAYSIASITTATDAAVFPANGWGYSFGTSSNFSPIPALSSPVELASTTVANNVDTATTSGFTDDEYDFTIAAKADLSKAAGTYTDTIVFSVVANPAPRVYLQDLTTEQCKSLELEKQYLYYDRRDEKAYTIARLADNNCWMTSNLRLGNEEGGDSITLTSQDTNLAPGETFTLPASAGGVWASANTDQAGTDTLHMYSNGTVWLDGSTIKDQSTDGAPSTPSKYAGNYYNWRTATAGTGLYNNTTTNTTHDICPKGWRLPSGGANGEYQALYEVTGNDYDAFLSSGGNWSLLAGRYGYLGSADFYGTRGLWWSSTPTSAAINSYYLYIGESSTINPQEVNAKASGLSVRCIYQPTIEGLDSEVSFMQDMTDTICKATPTPLATDNVVPQATLIDIRGKDGSGTVASPVVDKNSSNYQTYIVRKLADGNCWMVQNLNMTLSTSITLTSDTTDIGYGYSQNALGAGHNASNTSTQSGRSSWTPNSTTQTAEGTAWAQDGGNIARSFEPGENVYFPGGVGTGTLNSTNNNYSGYNTTGDPWYHIGNYYNWHAATAGTGTAAMGTSYEEAATDSICPKGWKLPGNYGTKSFFNLLFTAYNLADNDATSSSKTITAPLSFVYSGFYYHSGARAMYKGYIGDWWTSDADAALYAHFLNMSSTRILSQNNDYKGYGLPVRCVNRSNDIADLGFLQDISTQLCSATEIGVSTELVDKRDSKNYTIAKLADGKCWMTSNLRLGNESGGASIALTPALTDLTDNFTLLSSNNGVWYTNAYSDSGSNMSRMYSNSESWIRDDLISQSQTVVTTGTPDSPAQYLGNYYNWYTATAGTGAYSNGTTAAVSSICPRGWKLPSGGSENTDFANLYSAYQPVGSGDAPVAIALRSHPANFGVVGYYRYHQANGAVSAGGVGFYWSANPSKVGEAYNLEISASHDEYVVPAYSYSKIYGFSVRCLAR